MIAKSRPTRAQWLTMAAVILGLLYGAWTLVAVLSANINASPMLVISRDLHVANATTKGNKKLMNSILGTRLENCGDGLDIRPNHSTRMRNELWHVASFPTMGDIMVFSAFYDDRPSFDGKVFLRLFTVTTIQPKDNLLCQVWYDNFTSPLTSRATADDTGRGLNYKNQRYQERLYSCEIPKIPHLFPSFVSLHTEKCAKSTILVPVTISPKDQVHDVGICVVVAYGTLNPDNLIEWVEYNKILGVGEINVYDSRIDAKSKRVFQYYQDEGIVQVHKAAPSINDWCKWCQKLTVISALNDCMYRNMYRYKHLMVIDFDEFIIPTKDNTLPDLLKTVRRTWVQDPPGYLFRNTYFFLDIKPKYEKKPAYLQTQRFVHRQAPSDVGYSPKSIVNPRRCMVMQNHYCMKRTPDVSGSFTMYVKPEYALSHHYKRCHFDKEKCDHELKSTFLDESALRFGAALNESVSIARNRLGSFR